MLGDSIKRRRGKVRTPKPGRPDRPGKRRGPAFSWGRWIGAALVILVGSFLVGFLLSTQVLFPRPETAGTGVPVPDLYGETQEQAEATLLALGLVVGEVREMKSMTTQAGRVLAQSPLPGQQLLPGAVVDLGVSDGPPELRLKVIYK